MNKKRLAKERNASWIQTSRFNLLWLPRRIPTWIRLPMTTKKHLQSNQKPNNKQQQPNLKRLQISNNQFNSPTTKHMENKIISSRGHEQWNVAMEPIGFIYLFFLISFFFYFFFLLSRFLFVGRAMELKSSFSSDL